MTGGVEKVGTLTVTLDVGDDEKRDNGDTVLLTVLSPPQTEMTFSSFV